MEKKKFFSAKNVTGIAIFLALVIVLQLFGGYFKIGATSFNFVLVPIVLGGVIYGCGVGAFLGFCSGLIILLQGVFGVDGFTLILFEDHPVITTLVCLVKGVAAGYLAALVYKLLQKKNAYLGVFLAGATAPIVNTGLFIFGALFMSDTLNANFVADGSTVLYFLIIVCAGVNFLVELAINLIASPSVYKILRVIKKDKFAVADDVAIDETAGAGMELTEIPTAETDVETVAKTDDVANKTED